MKQIKYIFLLSIIFFSCDEINTTSDFNNGSVFLCLLKNDQPIQKAYLYNVVDVKSYLAQIGRLWFDWNNDFIHDAEIIISDGIISSQLQVREFKPNYSSFSEYTYSDDSIFYGKVLPNKKYDLQLKVNNEIVTGSTITPGEFSISMSDTIYPYQNTGTGTDNYRISWTKSNNSFQYLVFVNVGYKSNDGETVSHFINKDINTVDTFAIVTFPARTISRDGKEYHQYSVEFIVVAVDKNYYDHIFLSRDRAGLSSQYGVFGSSITESCTAYIKYKD
jgi:hypothetical protein